MVNTCDFLLHVNHVKRFNVRNRVDFSLLKVRNLLREREREINEEAAGKVRIGGSD